MICPFGASAGSLHVLTASLECAAPLSSMNTLVLPTCTLVQQQDLWRRPEGLEGLCLLRAALLWPLRTRVTLLVASGSIAFQPLPRELKGASILGHLLKKACPQRRIGDPIRAT